MFVLCCPSSPASYTPAGYQLGISFIFRKNSRELGPEKYYRLIMIRVTRTLEKGGFQEKLLKCLTFKLSKFLTETIFGLSHRRYVPLKAELPLPSSCCKGEACLPRSHYKEEPSTPRSYIEGKVGTSKLGLKTRKLQLNTFS